MDAPEREASSLLRSASGQTQLCTVEQDLGGAASAERGSHDQDRAASGATVMRGSPEDAVTGVNGKERDLSCIESL